MEITEYICRKQTSMIMKQIIDAFQDHFGISIYDADWTKFEHIVVYGNPIQTYRYRGRTFLQIQFSEIEVKKTQKGVNLTMRCESRKV